MPRGYPSQVAKEAFDVVVVGAGAAGCVVASRLAESSERSVLLLEAGPDLRGAIPPEFRDGWHMPTLPDWGFESEPDGKAPGEPLRRGRLIGGTSWLTRFAVRGNAADFDAWAGRGNPGWRFEDLLPAFRRVEADAEFGDREWHGDHGPIPITRYPNLRRSAIHEAALLAYDALGFPHVDDHNSPNAVGAGPMPMSSHDGVRAVSVNTFLARDPLPANLTVRADSPVARVLLDKGRATGVQLTDGTEIHAGWIVLSGGTYGSPTILMRSGIGEAKELKAAGVEPLVDLPGVGANLADHAAVDLECGWRGSGVTAPVLHSIATYRSSKAASDGPPDMMFWASDPQGEEAQFYFDPILLKPASRGSVRLRSADPSATPRITLPGVREPSDWQRLEEGYLLGLDLANRPEIRALSTEAAPTEPRSAAEVRRRVEENLYSIPHVVGTCRVGPSPEEGDVVNATGRVHGVERLSVIDASILPEPPSGFPHLITVALAEHLSEGLRTLL
jgi:choline dehydrogenase